MSGIQVMLLGSEKGVITLTGDGVLYVDGGALKFKWSSGTVTTIANA